LARTVQKLTPLKVARLAAPGMYSDGAGLYLQVTASGAKSWIYRFSLRGKAREMGLGSAAVLGLSEARTRANESRRLCQDGIDPIEARKAAHAQAALDAAKAITFKEAATTFIASHRAGWRNPKHAAQWTSTLETYAYPIIGKLSVQQIDTVLVMKVIEPIWAEIPETASRVRGRIEKVLDWAKARGYRQGDNPARWRGHLDTQLPRRSKVRAVRHHPALPFVDIPEFMAELRVREGLSAKALEFTILTAARTSATIGAIWSEIDLNAKVWTVPPDRAGTKITGEEPTPRRVPLCDRAIAILRALPRQEGNPHVFIGASVGKGLSDMAMLELMRDMRPGYVPHGFRSTFKDWCAETTNYPNEVSEAALWHVIDDKVEAAYRRGTLFEKRRKLMDDWARYCDAPKMPARGQVVELRPAV
jgi:integrase